MAQLLLGLVNGSFYAMLSLGLAIIFGLLNVINLSHGALYMMGAFAAWMGMNYLGLNYWIMLGLAPLVVAIFGIVIERTMLRRLYKLDHLYGLLLMIGLSQLLEGLFRSFYGVSGKSYVVPAALSGSLPPGPFSVTRVKLAPVRTASCSPTHVRSSPALGLPLSSTPTRAPLNTARPGERVAGAGAASPSGANTCMSAPAAPVRPAV